MSHLRRSHLTQRTGGRVHPGGVLFCPLCAFGDLATFHYRDAPKVGPLVQFCAARALLAWPLWCAFVFSRTERSCAAKVQRGCSISSTRLSALCSRSPAGAPT